MYVTLFSSIRHTSGGKDYLLQQILNSIKSGFWSKRIIDYRAWIKTHGKNDPKSEELKTNLPYFTTSGTFSRRSDEGLVNHSGFIAIDIDSLPEDRYQLARKDLQQDRFVYSFFRSCSGNGLCIILRINPDEHYEAFRQAERYFIREHGLEIDFLADISRARFISYDPDLYLNESAAVFEVEDSPDAEIEEAPPPVSYPVQASGSLLEKAVFLVERFYQFEPGQRHKFIYNLAKVANRFGISETDLEGFVYSRYDHFRAHPSNAIRWVYKNCKAEAGQYDRVRTESLPASPSRTPAEPRADRLQASYHQPIAGSFETILDEESGRIKIGKTIDEFVAELDGLELKWDSPVPRPEPIIEILGHTIGSAGNLVLVSGYSKAGKSGVLSAIIAGASRLQGDQIDTLGFEVKRNQEGKALLHIDTEQSRYDFDRNYRKTIGRVGISQPPEWFRAIWLKGKSPTEMMSYTWALCHHYAEKYSGIHSIIIDGIGDYMLQLNDEKEAYSVVAEFEKMAGIFDCPLVTVLHLNPNSDKQRGHAGSQLRRKCETVMTVKKDEKDKRYSKIEFPLLRNAGLVPEILFEWNTQKGYHTFVEYESIGHQVEREKQELESLAVALLAIKPDIDQNGLIDEISHRAIISKASASTRLKRMIQLGIIDRMPDQSFALRKDLRMLPKIITPDKEDPDNGNGEYADVPF